ncbi:MAG: hypothetical protein ACU837_14180 [Gammaproteobacteria bacterium]
MNTPIYLDIVRIGLNGMVRPTSRTAPAKRRGDERLPSIEYGGGIVWDIEF